jgi:hypothetical protein
MTTLPKAMSGTPIESSLVASTSESDIATISQIIWDPPKTLKSRYVHPDRRRDLLFFLHILMKQ